MQNLKNKTVNSKWKFKHIFNSGGQGQIWKVESLVDGKQLAAKVFFTNHKLTKKIRRIETEIEIVKKINSSKNSANIVQIYDTNFVKGTTPDFYFYIMDFSKYGSLKDNDFFIGDLEISLKLFKEILLGMQNAHKAGIIHRDLKPENILLYPTQKEILISDFGISLIKDRKTDSKITADDEFLGPTFFVSPEQFKNPSDVDERSDIYSLGKILYFMLTGQGKTFREELDNLSKYFRGDNQYLALVQNNLIDRMVIEDKNKRLSNISEAIDEVEDILKKIEINSKRFLKSPYKENYDLLYKTFFVGEERKKFIKEFPKDILRHTRVLEFTLSDLVQGNKRETSEEILVELLEKYKRGKSHVAIKSVESFVLNATTLTSNIKKYPKYSLPKYYLAKFYNDYKSYEKAHKYISDSIEQEKDPSFKLEYILEFKDICKNCHCRLAHNPNDLLEELLLETASTDEKTRLYKILGEHLIDVNDVELGLKYLEAYLNEKPEDVDIRFKCALQYSNVNQSELSYFHYQAYLNNKSDNGSALNNLGVLFDKNKMPVKAMKYYRKSFEQGETLAGSNIANTYLNSGFKKEAYDLLKRIIRENESYDDNVNKILGRVASSDDDEREIENKLISKGTTQNHHNIQYILKLTDGKKLDWSGCWLLDSRHTFEIVKSGESLEIEEFGSYAIKLKGHIKNNCIEINSAEIPYRDTYTKGFLYLTSDNNGAGCLFKNDGSIKEVVLKKIPDKDKFLSDQKKEDPILSALNMFK